MDPSPTNQSPTSSAGRRYANLLAFAAGAVLGPLGMFLLMGLLLPAAGYFGILIPVAVFGGPVLFLHVFCHLTWTNWLLPTLVFTAIVDGVYAIILLNVRRRKWCLLLILIFDIACGCVAVFGMR